MVFDNPEFIVPDGLVTESLVIRPLLETDVELDYEAVMETRDFLRKWEQSTWPADDFTLEANLKDLERHASEHRERVSFTYTVMNSAETACLGCIYIFPRTVRWLARASVNATAHADWADFEAVLLFWVRQSRIEDGLDRQLLALLRKWVVEQWAFDGLLFMTNEQCERQVAMWEAAGLTLQFEIQQGNNAGKERAYA